MASAGLGIIQRHAPAGMCVKLAYRAPFVMACGLGLAEFGGGLLLAASLLTPLGALLVTVVMFNAVYHVHWPKGFFVGNGGYEFNLLIAGGAVALASRRQMVSD